MKGGTKLYALLLFCIGSCLPKAIASKNTLPVDLFKRDLVQELRWNSLRTSVRVAVLEYDPAQYQKLKQASSPEIQINLPTAEGDIKLNLVRNFIHSRDFILNTDKAQNLHFTPGLHYKGIIDGQPNSLVAISFFDEEVTAMVNTTDGRKIVVGHTNAFRRKSFAVYDASRVTGPGMDCTSEGLPNYEERLASINQKVMEQRSAKCVRIYFELGKSVYDNKGGSVGAANYISSVFNFVAALYANEQISVVISEIFVWTTQEPYSTSSATSALYNFGSTKQDNFNGDLAQFVRLKPSGSMSGVAWLNVLCYTYFALNRSGRFSYTEVLPSYNDLPSYSWTVEVVTHELGHNLGSPHTQSCTWTGGALDNCATTEGGCAGGPAPVNGGTIMSYCHLTSYGINFNNGFGPQPGALIRSKVNEASCLSQCSSIVVSCNAPSGLSVTNLTSNSVTLNWASSGASNYTVQYKTSSASTWTTATSSTTSLSHSLTGLTVGTSYNWQVRSNCGTTSSAYSAGTFSTSSSACLSATPANLSSANISTSSTTVNWGAVSGATGYEVQYKRTTTSTWSIAVSSTTALSWTLSNLSSGISYDWMVRAKCPDGSGPFGQSQFTSAVAAACNAPGNLAASNITINAATVSWDAVSDAFNYSVEYKLSTSSSWTTMNPVSATSFSFTGLNPGSTYNWRVKTNCSSGVSGYSTSSFSTTSPACDPPSELTSSGISTGGATLNWSVVSGAINYTLEYKLTSSSIWTIAAAALTTTTFSLSNLSAASNYDWRVKTNCSSASSGFTSSSFTTGTPVCNAPTGLTSSSITANSVSLGWSATSGAVSYSLEYKLSSSSTWTAISGNLSTTSYALTNLNAATLYNWQIKTNCATGSSGFSSGSFTTSAAPICNAPSGLNVSSLTSSSVNISWSAVSGALNYTVEYKSSTSSTWLVIPGGQTTTSVTLNGLNSSASYDWRVKANCSSGSSGYTASNFTTATIIVQTCNAPGNLTASNIATNSASLNWGIVSGASNYSIQYKLSSATTWTAVSGAMTGGPYLLTGLIAGSVYNWQVKSNCSSGSSPMTQSSFTTLSNVVSTCPGAVDAGENGTRTSAPVIPLNTNVLAKIFPSGDNDYFKFVLIVGGTVSCSLTNLPADYDLRIVNTVGTTVGLSQKSNLTSELVTVYLNAGTYYARIYGWGTSSNASLCYTLKVQSGSAATSSPDGSPSGIHSTNELITTIFPNPVRSALNFDIYGLDASARVTVLDIQNRQLIQTVTKSKLNQMDVSNLAPGFYFLRVEDENKRRTMQKFMKAQ